MGNSPAIFSDALDQQLPTSVTQTGPTVGHHDVGGLGIAHRRRTVLATSATRQECH